MNRDTEVRCWRCGAEADVDWIDVHRFGDPAPTYIRGRTVCPTPGCVDENDTPATSPEPPSPEELARKADAVVAELRRITLDWPEVRS